MDLDLFSPNARKFLDLWYEKDPLIIKKFQIIVPNEKPAHSKYFRFLLISWLCCEHTVLFVCFTNILVK